VTIQGSEDTQKVLNVILKGMNDIKSELGSVKKLIQPSETSKPNAVQVQGKPGWRSNEQDGKPEKRTKFANVTKITSAPQPLQTSRMTQMYSSDDSDEQEANFAGAMLSKQIASRFDFRSVRSLARASAARNKEASTVLRSLPLCVLQIQSRSWIICMNH
jgi:hypothetical protein